MRHTHTIVLLATPLLLAAQQGIDRNVVRLVKQRTNDNTVHHRPAAAERSDATALWSEDFETGLAGWTVETSAGGVDWALTSTGNIGGYAPGPLESTSGYPGGHWIVADSDAEGTDGEPENTTITSPPILGFDTMPYMLLRFEQSFRQLNNDHTLVEVTGNGGADWSIFEVNTAIAGNQSTPGAPLAQTITLNISPALEQGSGTILLRFRWISDQGFTYSWQVDDIALLPARPNDLVMLEATHAAWAQNGSGYRGMPCTIYPIGETRDLEFSGTIGNNGSEPQTGVHLGVEVTGPDGYSAALSSPTIELQPAMTESLLINGYVLPDVEGEYELVMSAEQDQTDDVPGDNTIARTLRVDPHVFARDEGVVISERDNGGQDYELGNRFWIQGHGRSLEAVDVAFGPSTDVGAVVTAKLYDGYFDYLGHSDPHEVTQMEINSIDGTTFVTLPMTSPIELDGDRLYLVCIHVEIGDEQAHIANSGTSLPQTSMIYRYDTDTWYYTTSTPMVRMRLSTYVGMGPERSTFHGLSAFPNPFDDATTVVLTTNGVGPMRWELRDATGRLVREGSKGDVPAGEHKFLLDGEGLAAGVYQMTLLSGGVRSSVKLVRQARR